MPKCSGYARFYDVLYWGIGEEEVMDDEDCIVVGLTPEDEQSEATVESLWQYTALPEVRAGYFSQSKTRLTDSIFLIPSFSIRNFRPRFSG